MSSPADFTVVLGVVALPATPKAHALQTRPFAYSDACAGLSHEWVAIPGGYWVSETMCAPLTVRVGSRTATVRIGIGTPCAGQAPPVGPTES